MNQYFERLRVSGRRFAASRGGNVGIMFGLLSIPMLAAVGLAVDYGRASQIRADLQAAADAASIAAIAKPSAGYKAAASMYGDGKIQAGISDAINIFNGNLATSQAKGYSNLDVKVKVTKKGTTLTSKVTFTADVQTSILGAFTGSIGKGTMSIGGSATASNDMPLYIDFYLLLDNTPSMGVGATTADINKMVASTSDKCAFACHDLSANGNDYYALAKKLGVQMRIDVLRGATQQLMDTAKSTAAISTQFRAAIYTFGAAATSRKLTTIQSLTSDLGKAKTSAAKIDLMTVPYQNFESDTLTDYGTVLPDINDAISNPGDGSSSSSPQKYLFFVSDGVADRVNGSPGCTEKVSPGKDPQTGKNYVRCQEPLDVEYCKKLKKRGIKVAVLYTTYLPLPTNSWYMDWISPFEDQIGKNMQECASPGLYFEVSPSQGISEAMEALFKKAISTAHLTK
jgi:Flp pilus assembly protein TadG